MQIISARTHKETVTYTREFDDIDCPGAGYSFDCDKDGKLDHVAHGVGADNLRKCLDGTHNVKDMGVRPCHHSWVEDAVGKCRCGRLVTLSDPLDNLCGCGALQLGRAERGS